MTRRADREEVEIEAARWVWRGDRDGETPAYRAAREAWVEQDPARAGVLLRMEAIWASVDRLDKPAGLADDNTAAPAPRRSVRRGWAVTGTASALAASLALIFLPGTRGQDYATAVGEHRQIRLADESQVAINTNSRLEIAYSDRRRVVTVEDGEAWFHVAKDRTRPFVVAVGPVRVEAVGTAFSVRRRAGGADVLVTEGVVRVWTEDTSEQASFVRAGSGVFVADDGQIPRALDTAGVDRQLAWRGGEIDLAGDTLAAAVAEINRYNVRPIVVDDPGLAARRLHGVFRLDDPDGFARTAAAALGGRSTSSGRTIVIGRRASGAAAHPVGS